MRYKTKIPKKLFAVCDKLGLCRVHDTRKAAKTHKSILVGDEVAIIVYVPAETKPKKHKKP